MRGGYLRTAFLAPMDRLSDRLTWKRLQIDGNILGGISQALYPGEGEKPKNWLSRVLSLVSTPRRKIMQSYAYAGVKYAQCLQM